MMVDTVGLVEVIGCLILAVGILWYHDKTTRRTFAKSKFEIEDLQLNDWKFYGEALKAVDFTKEQWFVMIPERPGRVEHPIACSETVIQHDGLILFPPTTQILKVHLKDAKTVPEKELNQDYLTAFPRDLGHPTEKHIGRTTLFQFQAPLDPRFLNYLWFHDTEVASGGRFWSISTEQIQNTIVKWIPGQRSYSWSEHRAKSFATTPLVVGPNTVTISA